MLLKLITFLLPWAIRRLVMNWWFKYEIHPTAHIGFAWIFPKKLVMKAGARIDHFTVAIHLDQIEMHENATIGRSNWITGFPTNHKSHHFEHQIERKPELFIGESAAITKKHHIDCTNTIRIGRFSIIAGYSSQLLTHSIDVLENRQDSKPINVGEYTFVGTNVVILGGSNLPSFSVLGAKSMLNKNYVKEWTLYAGVPAKSVTDISKDAKYFNRLNGIVY